MIRTRPEGKAEDVKPLTTKAKSSAKKISNKFEEDKSPPPQKVKSAPTCDFSDKIKTPPSSPMKTTSSSVPKTLDANNYSQEVNLDHQSDKTCL